MDIKGKIQAIIEGIPGLSFSYGTKFDSNINADGIDFPVAILLEPDSGGFNVDLSSGHVRDRSNVFIQFLDKIRTGEQAEYREQKIESMKSYAVEFIRQANASNTFQDFPINGYNWVKIVDTYDANVVGIELNIPNVVEIDPRPC